MKYLRILVAVALSAGILSSCAYKLDSHNYIESDTSNFPTNLDDAEMLVTSMYANLNHSAKLAESSFYFTCEVASDDRYGGGRSGGGDKTERDHLMLRSDTDFDFLWKMHYRGVYLSNTAIEGLLKIQEDCGGTEKYNQMLGEAYYMRAYYYYELAVIFGDVPLMLSTTQEPNSPRVEASKVYAQMGSDLLNAISLMSSQPYNAYVSAGHATKWAAEALLARTFLFYTGFYQQESMPLADEGTLTKSEVVNYINDCVDNSGHSLVGDFRNLWPYTNEYTVKEYKYTKDVTGVDGKPLLWAGNGNCKEVFALKFCNFCGYTYENQEGYSNFYVPYFGFAGANNCEATFPYGNGNGFGPVTNALWDEWQATEPGDLRREASIMNSDDELDMSKVTSTSVTGQWESTGLWGKKMMPVLATAAFERQGSWTNSIFWAAYPEFDKANNYGMTQWGGHFQDLMIIRFADVLLMQSELTGDPTGMNRVRARVGLPAVGYSLEALQRERRHELAFEGVRWADMRRWHIAEDALSKQNGATLDCAGQKRVMRDGKYAERYKATDGFFPIPLAQIQLSDGVLTQNKGWSSADDCRYTRWEAFE